MHPVRWQRQAAPIWDASPPPPKLRKYDQLKVVGRSPLELVVLNEQLEETWTHYADKRTVFCTGPFGGCWLDHELVGRPRYGAWLAVKLPPTRVTYLLRLTAIAVSVEPRLRLLRGQLRGRRLLAWRIGGIEASEMHCKLVDGLGEVADLLPAPDVRFAIEHMMEAKDRPCHPPGTHRHPFREAAKAKAKEVPNER